MAVKESFRHFSASDLQRVVTFTLGRTLGRFSTSGADIPE
jgi:hypothetical protein